MFNERFLALLLVLGLLTLIRGVSLAKRIEAAPPITAEEIDAYLREKGSPLAGQGVAFVRAGRTHNVEPRLLVAIAGAETTFGKRTCARYNAWNWFHRDTTRCSVNAFASWAEGIETVASGLRRLYLDRGRTTIPQIAEKYTATDRETWIRNVTLFYRDELGGDPGDLTFDESATKEREDELQRQVEGWWKQQQAKWRQQFEEWLAEQQRKLQAWLERQLERQLQEACGASTAVLLVVALLVRKVF